MESGIDTVSSISWQLKDTVWPPVSEEEISYGKGVKGSPHIVIPGLKALVNPEVGGVYKVVTKDYLLVRHEELVEATSRVIAKFPEYGNPSVSVEFAPGARMKLEYKFDKIQHEIATGDLINPTWTFFNSYNGGWALRGMFGAFRLICSNGAVIGEKFVSYRQEHHQIGEDIELLGLVMEKGMLDYSSQVELWKSWTGQELTREELDYIIRRVGFTPGQMGRMLEEEETKTGVNLGRVLGTPERRNGREILPPIAPDMPTIRKWDAYNAVTQFITHGVDSLEKRKRLSLAASAAFEA